MKIGPILKVQQPDIHSQLNKNYGQKHNKNKNKGNGEKKDDHSLSFYENLMKHDSHCRGKGGAIKQRKWGE